MKNIILISIIALINCNISANAQTGIKYPYVENAPEGPIIVLADENGWIEIAEVIWAYKNEEIPKHKENNGNVSPRKLQIANKDIEGKFTWREMRDKCPEGWRLPKADELQLMPPMGAVDKEFYEGIAVSNDVIVVIEPAITDTPLYKIRKFKTVWYDGYWSSSKGFDDETIVIVSGIDESYCHTRYAENEYQHRIRCVRDVD